MEKRVSSSWKGSVKGKKQRVYRDYAPLHLRRKMLSSNLSEDLRKKYSRRSIPVRKGDTVKILRGEFTGKTGKISLCNLKNLKVYVEGVQRSKRDGSKVNIPLDPSNLQVTELYLEDKRRISKEEKKK